MTRLAERLRSEFGITVKALQLIQSYLSGCTQCIGGDISGTHNCSTEIPLGSVLGHFLFSVCISPIADVIESFDVAQHQYADDANMYCALESKYDTITTDRIEACTNAVQQWYAANGMQLNPAKSEVLLVATHGQSLKFTGSNGLSVAGARLDLASSVRSLSFLLDNRLSFNEHVTKLYQACNYHIRSLKHIRPMLTDSVAVCRWQHC